MALAGSTGAEIKTGGTGRFSVPFGDLKQRLLKRQGGVAGVNILLKKGEGIPVGKRPAGNAGRAGV